MLETVRKPNLFSGIVGNAISDVDLTKNVWDYYWTSYSRGVDGGNEMNQSNVSNIYLNGYQQQRSKSIYDPCPYGFRVPVNGTYNRFSNLYTSWKSFSCISGVIFSIDHKRTWLLANGYRVNVFTALGKHTNYKLATISGIGMIYILRIDFNGDCYIQRMWVTAYGTSVRCIEEC